MFRQTQPIENKYLLGTSMARPAIAKRLVEVARKKALLLSATALPGKGNDQIRFEVRYQGPGSRYQDPSHQWRMTDVWTMQSVEDEIEYCKRAWHRSSILRRQSATARDRNLWHIIHEGLELEDPANEPNYDHLLVLGTTPEKAPDGPEYVTMTFEEGVPTSINGEKMKVADIIRKVKYL